MEQGPSLLIQLLTAECFPNLHTRSHTHTSACPSSAGTTCKSCTLQSSQLLHKHSMWPPRCGFHCINPCAQAHNALSPAVSASSAMSRRRRRQPDTLSAVLDEEGPDKPPKRARAFLDAFPEKDSCRGLPPEQVAHDHARYRNGAWTVLPDTETLLVCDTVPAHTPHA
eukprot:scaffold22484_cov22-Tisochrysis_lutea.AAC.2